ncbi:MAG: pyruvate kinase [Candidatus Omnitrophica bacterium]|nr:pyruvate kinase [Candidatus Omnitrophota bacterium]
MEIEELSEMRRAKIIATIGPASDNEAVIRKFLELNVDVLRINFSHGSRKEHLDIVNLIRKIANQIKFQPAILLDLPGPKIRVGELPQGFVELKSGEKVCLCSDQEKCSRDDIPVDVKDFEKIVKSQERILLVDGRIELRVLEVKNERVIAEVKRGGILQSRQGINLPDSKLPFPPLTERDKDGIELAFAEDIDWLALSFVRMEEDLIELRDLVATRGEHMGVIAKIERPEAIRNIDRIIQSADAVMVARGDLGVEMGVEEVPVLQKKIISLCHLNARPSIVATQMLESMVENPFPTRAEVSDIANAIYDGADCVMLSDETAIGKYPVQAVEVMLEVIRKTEASIDYRNLAVARKPLGTEVYDALGHAVCMLACDLNPRAIIVATFSGFTAQMVAKYRPPYPIYAFTPNNLIRNKMNLIWGVRPFLAPYTESIEELLDSAIVELKHQGLLQKKDLIIFVAGLPLTEVSESNFIKVHEVE